MNEFTSETGPRGVTPVPKDLKTEHKPDYAQARRVAEQVTGRAGGGSRARREEGSFGFATYARGGQVEGPSGTGPEPGQHLHHRGHPPKFSERELLPISGASGEAPRSEMRFQRAEEGGPAGPGQPEWTYFTQLLEAERGAERAPEAAQWWGNEIMQTLLTVYEVGALPRAADFEFAKLVIKLLKAPKSFNIWDELRKEIWFRSRIYRLLMITKGLPKEDQRELNIRREFTAEEQLEHLRQQMQEGFRRMQVRYRQEDPDEVIREEEKRTKTKMTDRQKEWWRERVKEQNELREELGKQEAPDLEERLEAFQQDWRSIKKAIEEGRQPSDAELQDEELRKSLKAGIVETGTLVPSTKPTVLDAKKLAALLDEAEEVAATHTARVSIYADFQTKEALRASSEAYLTRLYGPGRDAPTAEHLRKAVERGAYREGEVPQRLILREVAREWNNVIRGGGVVPWTVEELDRVRQVRGVGAQALDSYRGEMQVVRQGQIEADILQDIDRKQKLVKTPSIKRLEKEAIEGSVAKLPPVLIEALVRMEDGEYRTRIRRELAKIEEGIEAGVVDPDDPRIEQKVKEWKSLKEQALNNLPPEVEARIQEEVTAKVEKDIKKGKVKAENRDEVIDRRVKKIINQLKKDIEGHWRVYGSTRIVIGNPNHPDSISHLWGNPQKGGHQAATLKLVVERAHNAVNLESQRVNQPIRKYNERINRQAKKTKRRLGQIRAELESLDPDNPEAKQRIQELEEERSRLEELSRRMPPLRLPRRILGEGEKWRTFGEAGLYYAILMTTDEYAQFMPFGVMLGKKRLKKYGRKFISMLMAEQRGIEWDGSDALYIQVLHRQHIINALRRGEYKTPLGVDVNAKNGEYGVPRNLGAREIHKLTGGGRGQSDLGALSKAGADFDLLVPMLHYYHLEYEKPVKAIDPETGELEEGVATFTISIWDLMEKYGLGADEAIPVLDMDTFKDPRVEGGQEMKVVSSEIVDIEPYRNTSAHVYHILQLALAQVNKELGGKIEESDYLLQTLTDHMIAGPRITWQMLGLSGKRVYRSKEDNKLHWIDGEELLETVSQIYLMHLIASIKTGITATDASREHRVSGNPVDDLKLPMIDMPIPEGLDQDLASELESRMMPALEFGRIMAKNVPVTFKARNPKSGEVKDMSLFEVSQAIFRTYVRKWRLAPALRKYAKPQLFLVGPTDEEWEIQLISKVDREFLNDVIGIQYPLAA